MDKVKLLRISLLILLILPLVVFSVSVKIVFAQTDQAKPTDIYRSLGAALAVAGSTIGAGIALQGINIGGSALLAERPEAFTQVLLLAGLSEGIAIYGLLIAFLLMG
ncbi:MAG: V-type ATP synthase subunit K [Thermoproteota archaeon]|jgi:V/A-type H+-transporting ATPase subunit K|uniref:V-type ATP synthase subunit K n=1 Tax=Candidatus Methanodesulfokora washburnensis TaxID=2478471 RepID=A0A429GFS2_9CREN|nr:ATP synthase subunit C [Candidatus Methanodesulfokores washburnensis]RSN72619.1 V-type ATP synthase subunit K [Candidatus Methanodesulfokores washburnensis]RZN59450.1 MAG: V-type ATP synthase subunit K [Candidatus Methanodesulfokores washburnensis]TDA38630.1 MAG: V-type ATP synthase subunit K [Candidatus Korarchaeota archaeon]